MIEIADRREATADGRLKQDLIEAVMDKELLKETMFLLEAHELKSAREQYLEYLNSARLDRSETVDDDEQAQAEIASSLSEALDDAAFDHFAKIKKLATIDFGPKTKVEEGALVKMGGRYFVIAVSTGKFACGGNDVIGISTQAPIYAEMQGKRAGETFMFNGRDLMIEAIS
ncbi:hypothetical protein V1291_003946 [Nitrobacteraceae bacterium AZCC 1564]